MNFCIKKASLLMICLVSLAEVKAVTHNPQTYDQFVTKNQLMQSIYPLLVDMGYSSHGTIEAIMRYIMSEEIVDITDLYRAGVKQPDINNIVNIRTQFSAISTEQDVRAMQEKKDYVTICLESLPRRGVPFSLITLLECFKLGSKRFENGLRNRYN